MSDFYSTTAKELTEKTKIPLLVMNAPGDVHVEYAVQMIGEIVENNKQQKNTVFILPCGPIEQYAIFTKFVNRLKIDLKNVYFIHMDEYMTENGKTISEEDESSFKKCMKECLYAQIDQELIMPEDHRIFPIRTAWMKFRERYRN